MKTRYPTNMQTKNHTGVVFRGERVEWTTLRESKDGLERVAGDTQELLPESESEDIASIDIAGKSGVVHASVSIAKALTRVMDLPSADAGELAGMVELQVGKISPFPVEEMVISFEVLKRDDNSSTVLIAAVKREKIEELRSRGITPHHIDIDLMARWYGLQTANIIDEEGRYLYLFVEEEQVELIVTRDGEPILIRSILERDDLDRDQYLSEICEELHFTLMSIEADWGEFDQTRISIFQSDPEDADLAERLRKQESAEVKVLDLSEAGELSELLARRGAERADTAIDLVPNEWREQAKQRLLKRKLYAIAGVFLALWLAAVGGIFGYNHLEKLSVKRMEEKAEELKEPAQKSKQLQMRIRALEQYADRTYSILECLRESTVLLPRKLELISFNFKKGKEVNLRGLSDSTRAGDIYSYFQALESSEKFNQLKDQQVSTVTRRGKGRCSQFKVTLVLANGNGQQ